MTFRRFRLKYWACAESIEIERRDFILSFQVDDDIYKLTIMFPSFVSNLTFTKKNVFFRHRLGQSHHIKILSPRDQP